jgi:hypothetical protein
VKAAVYEPRRRGLRRNLSADTLSLISNLLNCEEKKILLFNPPETRYGLGTPGHMFINKKMSLSHFQGKASRIYTI